MNLSHKRHLWRTDHVEKRMFVGVFLLLAFMMVLLVFTLPGGIDF